MYKLGALHPTLHCFNNKKIILKYVLIINLILVCIHSIFSTIETSYDFYELKKPEHKVYQYVEKFITSNLISTYSKYTGANTGYGFFAPNVLSSCTVYINDFGKKYEIRVRNMENYNRISTLYSQLLTHELDKKNKNTEKENMKLEERYNELLYKAILSYHKSIFQLSNNVSLKLDLYNFVDLKHFKKDSCNASLLNIIDYKFK